MAGQGGDNLLLSELQLWEWLGRVCLLELSLKENLKGREAKTYSQDYITASEDDEEEEEDTG